MKIALYIRESREQIVLTPESKAETDLLARLTDNSRVVQIHRGSFYDCQGGWTRIGKDDDSTIIVLEPAAATEPSGVLS